jgi:hypothetical protein
MTETAVGTDLDQTADILRNLTAQITLDPEVVLDESRDRVDLILCYVVRLLHRIDIDRRKHVIGALGPNTMDIPKGEANMLLPWNVHTHHSRHSFLLPFLTLALLVTRVGADHAHYAFAADDAAVLADATNGATYFHVVITLLEWSNKCVVYQKPSQKRKGVFSLISSLSVMNLILFY